MNEQTVLIVSGDLNWCRITRFYLENASYHVFHADTGEVGMEMISQVRPNLVLLDWELPDLSPLAMTRAIRRDCFLGKLPIVLSGREMSSEDKLQSLDAGVDICLEGTVLPKEFIARIRALLRRVNGQF